MKAAVYHKYGSPEVLHIEEIPMPVPADNEVLIKVHAASVNYANPAMVRGEPYLLRLYSGPLKPKFKIPGGDIAGTVENVGKNVTRFMPGDEVFGDLSDSGFGGFAEYISAPENELVLKPANLTFEEAAAVPQAGVVALQGLRKGGIRPGQRVLINGSSGGIGTFAVQIAKSFGTEVTAVCSTRNLDLARSLGADQVIDYTLDDFTRNGRQYDLILATAGYRSIFDYKRALGPNGAHITAGGSMAQIFQAALGPLLALGSNKILSSLSAKSNKNDLLIVKELIEAGKVKPVIDRYYPLSEIADAFSYYEKGRTRGKIVITVS